MALEVVAQVGESPAHDPITQPDWRGDLTLLAHPPDAANADAQELRHLADIDDRDLRLAILKFIHECTRCRRPRDEPAVRRRTTETPTHCALGWVDVGSLQVGWVGWAEVGWGGGLVRWCAQSGVALLHASTQKPRGVAMTPEDLPGRCGSPTPSISARPPGIVAQTRGVCRRASWHVPPWVPLCQSQGSVARDRPVRARRAESPPFT